MDASDWFGLFRKDCPPCMVGAWEPIPLGSIMRNGGIGGYKKRPLYRGFFFGKLKIPK